MDTINWLESTWILMFQLDFVEWTMVLWGKGRAVVPQVSNNAHG